MKVGLEKKSWTEKIVDRKKNRGPIEICVRQKIVDRKNRGPVLKKGGTRKNIFFENLTVETSGGFVARIHLADQQKRYRLRYATQKARQL